MNDADVQTGNKWTDNRNLVIAWLLAFFPVGLYGLWKGNLFDKTWKVGITIVVVIVFFGVGIRFFHPAYVLLLYPVALGLLWKSPDIGKPVFIRFALAWCVVFVLFVTNNLLGEPGSPDYGGGEGGSCAAVMTQNNCTYFRDSDCNVIARECS